MQCSMCKSGSWIEERELNKQHVQLPGKSFLTISRQLKYTSSHFFFYLMQTNQQHRQDDKPLGQMLLSCSCPGLGAAMMCKVSGL